MLRSLRGVAFDLDGCIWAGPDLLPGAAALVAALRDAGVGVVFVTNSSRQVGSELADRLTRLGIPTEPGAALSALELLGEAVLRTRGPARVLALGSEGIRRVLERAGHTVLGPDQWREADAVAVGHDPAFDYVRLAAAARAVAMGAAFYAVNLDPRLPVSPVDFEPGCGALAEAIAVASGRRPAVIGKPHPPIFEVALDRLGCPPDRAAMVGDSLEADVTGGRNAGMMTVWVDRAGAPPHGLRPDLTVRSLEELGLLWSASRP